MKPSRSSFTKIDMAFLKPIYCTGKLKQNKTSGYRRGRRNENSSKGAVARNISPRLPYVMYVRVVTKQDVKGFIDRLKLRSCVPRDWR